MSHAWLTLLLVTVAVAAEPTGPESATVRGESTTTRKRLSEIEQRLLANTTTEAIDELQRIIDDAGDDLISADGKSFIAARQYAHRFLTKLPPNELKKYRDRVEEPAAKLLATAKQLLDAAPLETLLDRYAISRPAEAAHIMLAEWAFERGQFQTAEEHWRSLLPDAETPFPAPKTPLALVRAKLILARLFSGDRTHAQDLLADFRKQHANDSGRLAGRVGNLVEILDDTFAKPLQVPSRTESIWSTLGGSATRDGVVAGLPRHWPSQPTWRTPIPRSDPQARTRLPAVGAVRSVALHPVIGKTHAFIADAGRVIAFDLATGAATVVLSADQLDEVPKPSEGRRIPVALDADFSLTLDRDRLFVRLGEPILFPLPQGDKPPPTRPSVLLSLVPNPNSPKLLRIERSWQPPVPKNVTAAWDASPIVHEGRFYAAFARAEGGRVVHAIACYEQNQDRPVWVADVAEASIVDRACPEHLTLAGRNVVFSTGTGVIAAVNARTGRHAWSYRYPRVRKLAGDGRNRDVAPPIAADGVVFVAPADGDRIYAFDANSGQLLWNDGPLLTDQLIGIANRKLIAVLAGPVRGIRGYDTRSGSTQRPHGWQCHDDPGLASFGRGLVSDDYVLWPTAAGVFPFHAKDGVVASLPMRGAHGNLAFANGTLIVATPTEVWAYRPLNLEPPPTPAPLKLGGNIPRSIASPFAPPQRAELPTSVRLTATVEAAESLGASQFLPAISAEFGRRADGSFWLIRETCGKLEAIDTQGRTRRLDRESPTPTAVLYGVDRAVFLVGTTLTAVNPWTGERLWRFRSPVHDELTQVVPCGGAIIVVLGKHHLVGLNAQSGEAVWVVDAQGRAHTTEFIVTTAPHFDHITAIGSRLLVHRSDGRRWVLDPTTGQRYHDLPCDPLTSSPVPLDADTAIVSDGEQRVQALNLLTGRVQWTHDVGRDVSLAGRASQVSVLANRVWIATQRNFGTEIDALDITGQRIWEGEPFATPRIDVQLAHATSDEERLYVPSRQRVFAVQQETGREAWAIELPYAAEWRITSVRNGLLVWSSYGTPTEREDVIARFFEFPKLNRLPGLFSTALANWYQRTSSMMLIEPATGRILQRTDRAAVGPTAIHVTTEEVIVASAGQLRTQK